LRSGTKKIPGAETYDFNQDEKRMLEAWRDFVVAVDPDVVAGFNCSNFDLRILWKMRGLNIDLGPLGRVKGLNTQLPASPTPPDNSGSRAVRLHDDSESDFSFDEPVAEKQRPRPETVLNGRAIIDLIRIIQKAKKHWNLENNQLNQIVKAVLGEELRVKPYEILCALAKHPDLAKLRLAAICSLHVCLSMREHCTIPTVVFRKLIL
jgi:DNA polymerase delta subunit 1